MATDPGASVGTGPSFLLELFIPEADPGDAFTRIVAGELEGYASVQVEGRVVDPGSGAVVAEFADRRTSSGAIGLRDVLGDSGPDTVRELLEQIGSDLKHELERAFDGPDTH